MSKFDYRLKRIEESFPAPTVGTLLEALSMDELNAVILHGYREQLKEAKAAGAKAFAADLQLVIKHEEAKLPAPASHAAKLERTKRTKRLVKEIEPAKDYGRLSEDLSTKWHEHIKQEAAELRFAKRFPNLLNRLESGEIIEFTDANSMPVAMCKMLEARNPKSPWRCVEMISSYLPHRKEYIEAGKLDKAQKDGLWRPWFQYCKAAEVMRADILSGKAVMPPSPPPKPKASEPAPPTRAAAPAPSEPLPANVVEFKPMLVTDLQRYLRQQR